MLQKNNECCKILLLFFQKTLKFYLFCDKKNKKIKIFFDINTSISSVLKGILVN
jgi:hypothetical protein